jgi:hypothetical protein
MRGTLLEEHEFKIPRKIAMPAATLASKDSPAAHTEFSDRSTRLLLALWFFGGESVKRGELTKRVQVKQEKSKDCQKFFTELEEGGAIRVTGNKVSLTELGKAALGRRLGSTNLGIEGTVVGAWMAKALLQWIQQVGVSSEAATTNGNGKATSHAIASYDEFKLVALSLFEKLDKGYNYSGLVPIWHMRRELGDRVGREEFSDWMMEMQAEQVFYLQGGEAREASEEQKRDSITNKIRGLLFYASKPS